MWWTCEVHDAPPQCSASVTNDLVLQLLGKLSADGLQLAAIFGDCLDRENCLTQSHLSFEGQITLVTYPHQWGSMQSWIPCPNSRQLWRANPVSKFLMDWLRPLLVLNHSSAPPSAPSCIFFLPSTGLIPTLLHKYPISQSPSWNMVPGHPTRDNVKWAYVGKHLARSRYYVIDLGVRLNTFQRSLF